jgi:hypothetical protein
MQHVVCRDMAGIKYDPDVMRAFSYPTLQNRIYLEFDHLYRWHSLIPDVLNLGQRISFPDVVFQLQLLLDVSHTAHASLCLLITAATSPLVTWFGLCTCL